MKLLSKALAATLIVVGVSACGGGSREPQPVTEDRIESALNANNVPQIMAGCLAEKLVDKINDEQLFEIEAMAPQDESGGGAMSSRDALDRLDALNDKDTRDALALGHARCIISILADNPGGF